MLKKKKRDSVAEDPRVVDAALIYASVIEHTVNEIMFTPLPIRDLMDVIIGEALISRCPEKTDQCQDKGFCKDKACPYVYNIHTPVFVELLKLFEAGLSRFLGEFVRNLKEQTPGLVEAAIVEFVRNLKKQIPGLVEAAIVESEIAMIVRRINRQIPPIGDSAIVDLSIIESQIEMAMSKSNKQISPFVDYSIVGAEIAMSKTSG